MGKAGDGRWILETERLTMREMTDADFPALCKILQDEKAMYAYEHAFSDEEAKTWLENQKRGLPATRVLRPSKPGGQKRIL